MVPCGRPENPLETIRRLAPDGIWRPVRIPPVAEDSTPQIGTQPSWETPPLGGTVSNYALTP